MKAIKRILTLNEDLQNIKINKLHALAEGTNRKLDAMYKPEVTAAGSMKTGSTFS